MRVLRFAAVGVLNTAIDFGVLNLLIVLTGTTSGGWILLFNAVGFFLAGLNSYFLNRGWTFGQSEPGSLWQYFSFMLLTLAGVVLNTLMVYAFLSVSIQGAEVLRVNFAKVMATLISSCWNYLCYRFLVFAQGRNSVR